MTIKPQTLNKISFREQIVYLVSFIALVLIVTLFSQAGSGIYNILGSLLVLVVGVGSFGLLRRFQGTSKTPLWQLVFVGLSLSQIYFALTFWSTSGYNVALVLVVILFVFDKWFDKMETRWILAIFLVLIGALLLVPFRVL